VSGQRRREFVLADQHVRPALIAHLRERHPSDGTSDRIVSELGLCQGAARVDIAVVRPHAIFGYEIKSDRDSLNRLLRQIDWYGRVLDTMTLVAGASHLPEVERFLPSWWGLWIATGSPSSVCFSVLKPAQPNPTRSVDALVQLLWRDEAIGLLAAAGISSVRRHNRKRIWQTLVATLSEDALAAAVRSALCQRLEWPRRPSGELFANIS